MFKIEFDPRIGAFVVAVIKWGFVWQRVADAENQDRPLEFRTYDTACQYVQAIGLDKLYQDRSANKYNAYMADARRA